MSINLAALAALAAKTTDMTKAEQGGGGGDYTPPAAGLARVRLVGFFEIGKHESTWEGVTKTKDKVQMVFELSGPRHPPVERDGVKYPIRMTITETRSLNPKANFFKLFQRLNYKGDATHYIQLLGEDFIATVVHKADKKDPKKVYANLRDDAGYTIRPPFVPNPETGEDIRIKADPAITPLKAFLWDHADAQQWADIFIDGEYPAKVDDKGVELYPARSKNVIQNTILAATNFAGSPIAELLASKGEALDLPVAEEPARTQENIEAGNVSDDPLAGM